MSLDRDQPHYFGAGPALLPKEVLIQAAQDLVNYNSLNLGVGEISHRSNDAASIINKTKENLTKLLSIPSTHEVFFMQGGGTNGFSSIPTNLLASYALSHKKKARAAYAQTGSWSKKAAQEAQRLGIEVDIVAKTPEISSFSPLHPDTAYLFICDNETVDGVEFNDIPSESYLNGVSLVSDMSSNILSRPVDISRYGLIMAGAQKNIGLAGLTIYIINKELLNHADDETLRQLNIPLSPIAFDYPLVVKNNSAYNTIPIFTAHILKLVTDLLLSQGGLESISKINEKKAEILYLALESDFYTLLAPKSFRSNMNVVFKLPNEDLEKKFVSEAAKLGLTGLKGHRSVGGMRASIYNAASLESVQVLADFVTQFAKENK